MIQQVWEVDPLFASMTSQRHHEMRPVSLINVSLINDAQIIERSLRHVGMWVGAVCNYGVRASPSMGPPVGEIIDRGQLDDDGLVAGADFAVLLGAWGACR